MGTVRTEWVVCDFRDQITLNRCFKCLIYVEVLSTGGVKGHFARESDKRHKRMQCNGKESLASSHTVSSGKCPEFKRTLIVVRK